MQHKNNDIISLMRTPIAFLLQEQNKEKLINTTDENGWNFIHYAIAEFNLNKIVECLELDFEFITNSKNNKIPSLFLIQNSKNSIQYNNVNSIPFSKGFTPVHLCAYLINLYGQEKNIFATEEALNTSKKILDLILNKNNKILNIKDENGLSVSDYFFLLENLYLINALFKIDPLFETLHKVTFKTAKKIMELKSIKIQKQMKNTIEAMTDDKQVEIINVLDKIISTNDLKNKLDETPLIKESLLNKI